jgi:hypothetical protein
MSSKRPAILYLLIIILVVVAFGGIRAKTEKKVIEEPARNFSVSLSINNSETQTINLSDEETKEVKEEIEIFEKYKHDKDFVSAIGLITAPENTEEKGWLDHFLGNDVSSANNGQPIPRFFNKDKFHLLVGYDIEKIEKRDNVIYASVQELRIINASEEGAPPNWQTDIQNLTFEVVGTNDGLKISKYYHTEPNRLVDLKYEGFMAF